MINVKDDGSREEIEMNPLLAFVYNRDVDLRYQRIGLKYNEDWPNLPPSAFVGPGRDVPADPPFSRAEVYQPLIETYHAVVEDWGDAKHFEPLKLQVPENVAWGKAHDPIEEPVVARSSDIQIIIVAQEDLKGCFLQKRDYEFYQITLDGAKIWTWERGENGMELVAEELEEMGKEKGEEEDK